MKKLLNFSILYIVSIIYSYSFTFNIKGIDQSLGCDQFFHLKQFEIEEEQEDKVFVSHIVKIDEVLDTTTLANDYNQFLDSVYTTIPRDGASLTKEDTVSKISLKEDERASLVKFSSNYRSFLKAGEIEPFLIDRIGYNKLLSMNIEKNEFILDSFLKIKSTSTSSFSISGCYQVRGVANSVYLIMKEQVDSDLKLKEREEITEDIKSYLDIRRRYKGYCQDLQNKIKLIETYRGKTMLSSDYQKLFEWYKDITKMFPSSLSDNHFRESINKPEDQDMIQYIIALLYKFNNYSKTDDPLEKNEILESIIDIRTDSKFLSCVIKIFEDKISFISEKISIIDDEEKKLEKKYFLVSAPEQDIEGTKIKVFSQFDLRMTTKLTGYEEKISKMSLATEQEVVRSKGTQKDSKKKDVKFSLQDGSTKLTLIGGFIPSKEDYTDKLFQKYKKMITKLVFAHLKISHKK